jgi:tetratricopeptide (TPR) repeat protein
MTTAEMVSRGSFKSAGRTGSAAALAFFALLSIGGLLACGEEGPDPAVGGVKPPPTSTTTATTVATTPPLPAEPSLDDRRKAAKAAYDAGDYAKAMPELEAIVAKEPGDAASQTMLGDVYTAKGDKRAADAYLAATKADGGKDERLALLACKTLLDQRRYDDVIMASQAGAKSNEKSMALWMYLGLAQTGKMDFAGSVETYQKLASGWPDEPELLANLANAQAANGKKDDAKKTAKAALDKWTEVRSPKNNKEVKLGKGPDELCGIARAMRRVGDASGALNALGKYTIAKDELSSPLDIEKGFAKHQMKDDKTAYQNADKVLKITNNGSAPAHLLLAAVAIEQKKLDIAKAELGAYDMLGGDIDYTFDRKEIQAAFDKGTTATEIAKPPSKNPDPPKKPEAPKAPAPKP